MSEAEDRQIQLEIYFKELAHSYRGCKTQNLQGSLADWGPRVKMKTFRKWTVEMVEQKYEKRKN